MARNTHRSRHFSPIDRFIIEFDRILGISAGRRRTGIEPNRSADDRSRQLRESHNNAAAALGLRRGLKIAAQSSAAQSRARTGERDAEDTLKWLDQQMSVVDAPPSPLAALGYAGGLGIGISSRLLGDEAGRRIAGSHDQIRSQTQRLRADRLDLSADTDPASKSLIDGLRERADASTCLCGPHGHRVRSRPMSRFLKRVVKPPFRAESD